MYLLPCLYNGECWAVKTVVCKSSRAPGDCRCHAPDLKPLHDSQGAPAHTSRSRRRKLPSSGQTGAAASEQFFANFQNQQSESLHRLFKPVGHVYFGVKKGEVGGWGTQVQLLRTVYFKFSPRLWTGKRVQWSVCIYQHLRARPKQRIYGGLLTFSSPGPQTHPHRSTQLPNGNLWAVHREKQNSMCGEDDQMLR